MQLSELYSLVTNGSVRWLGSAVRYPRADAGRSEKAGPNTSESSNRELVRWETMQRARRSEIRRAMRSRKLWDLPTGWHRPQISWPWPTSNNRGLRVTLFDAFVDVE